MKAVSNSSVLIALSDIQRLDLLQQRFPDGILIPPAVWHEVVTTGGGRPGSQAVATASFIPGLPCHQCGTGPGFAGRARLRRG